MASTARKIAWEISQGIRPRQFVGVKSFEVLVQELFSLQNRYHPNTMTKFEISQWNKDLTKIIEAVMKHPKEKRSILYKKVDQLLNP